MSKKGGMGVHLFCPRCYEEGVIILPFYELEPNGNTWTVDCRKHGIVSIYNHVKRDANFPLKIELQNIKPCRECCLRSSGGERAVENDRKFSRRYYVIQTILGMIIVSSALSEIIYWITKCLT